MPRRLADATGGGRAAKRPRQRRKHLYLVTEDWEQGYSIRKVDLEEDYDANIHTLDKEQAGNSPRKHSDRRLPPAVFRLEAPHQGADHFTAAFGTKIMALHHTPRRYVPVFDVRTRCLSFGPRMRRDPSTPIYVPVADRLYGLDFDTFEMLHPPPPLVDPNCGMDVPKWRSWRRLPPPPFKRERVTSHAVHPDGRTIFVSIDGKTGATFSFDTMASSPRWTRSGSWKLPFKGPAHYDCDLDAWVGLARDPDMLGRLCSCDVPSTDDDDGCRQLPAWKLSKEKLFCQDPDEKHIGAALVCLGTGCRSKFCVVQCLSLDDREEGMYKEYLPERERYLLRLTTFSLAYDKNGDLRTAARRRVRSFELPKSVAENSAFLVDPVAFWM
ncbi:hypothetical protein CFC21_076943 [Triticum aestivum]|uniref:DUF1618 domain-containing protein n=2 Tax=Triticum aestivum TaxID=4565 RepID=A0A9R1KZ58_WHEAT|nr:hypothetical protein CFC21_076943 [Triticum aestivum]